MIVSWDSSLSPPRSSLIASLPGRNPTGSCAVQIGYPADLSCEGGNPVDRMGGVRVKSPGTLVIAEPVVILL